MEKESHLKDFSHSGPGGRWSRRQVFTKTFWTIGRPLGEGEVVAKVSVPNAIIRARGRKYVASMLREARSALRDSIMRRDPTDVCYGFSTFCVDMDDGGSVILDEEKS
jgi:hypothetical protein